MHINIFCASAFIYLPLSICVAASLCRMSYLSASEFLKKTELLSTYLKRHTHIGPVNK